MDGVVDTKVQATMPRASDWIWRPLYAKFWWSGVSLWWTAFMASPRNSLLADFFDTPAAGYLSVLFLPFAPLLVMGAGFLRAWLRAYQKNWESEALEEDADFFPVNLGGLGCSIDTIGPCLDPLDPCSGAILVGSPINPFGPLNPLNQRG
jgi:hypothetical protein